MLLILLYRKLGQSEVKKIAYMQKSQDSNIKNLTPEYF